jgi:hypothetical protein
MVTTIQISNELKDKLEKRKTNPKDSYEDVIWDMYEDTAELSAETKRRIAQSRKEAAEGKTIPFQEVMRKAGL